MAKTKQNNNAESKDSTASKESTASKARGFFRSERTLFITGIMILLVSAIVGLSFLSFFVTGQADQALLENLSLGELSSVNNHISNWMGMYGAFIAERCINHWIGIAAILYVVFFIRLGTRLMQAESCKGLGRDLVLTMVWSIWLSIALGFFFIDGYQDSFLYLGGRHGYDFSKLISANIGKGGTFLLILTAFIILSIFVYKDTIHTVRRIMKILPKLRRIQKIKWARHKANREKELRQREEDVTRREQELAAALAASGLGNAMASEGADDAMTPVANEASDANGADAEASDSEASTMNNTDGDTGNAEVPAETSEPVMIKPDYTDILPPDYSNDKEEMLNESQVEDDEVGATASDEYEDEVAMTQTDVDDEGAFLPNDVSVNTADADGFMEPAPQKPVMEESVATAPVATTAPALAGNESIVAAPAVETVSEPIEVLEDYDPMADLSHYKFPTFDLLKQYNNTIPIDMEEQNNNKEKIKKTLQDYDIEIQSISATVGPTITLFEIVPKTGTRIAKIRNLQDEIAMSIAAKTGIRIIAPIPGKTAIGIEVPNNDPQIVSMHSVITSRVFQESKYELPVALGKTITNEVFTFGLEKTPHLLVAGATGQGKSVGLNAILTSLLYKKHPSQLKFVLIDPKQVEFSVYSCIEKHYLAKLPDEEEPIITDVNKVVSTLNAVVVEMENRYALLKDAGLRNIKEYNEKFIHRELNPKKGHKYLPYIVVVVDEYGDLIMTAGKEIELPIARIAQKARAVGIHMIIATQRPSAKIITGIIKANFPARMAFRVGQSIDSSIILDQPGAQQLIGRGDLLFSMGNELTRVQCAFVDTPEVNRINKFIAEQQSYPTAFILPEPPDTDGGNGGGGGGNADSVDTKHLDPLFKEVAELVVATQQGSTSMIQRKFSIGFTRAGRIMDQLEATGIVGPYEGSKARSVLVGGDMELQNILDTL